MQLPERTHLSIIDRIFIYLFILIYLYVCNALNKLSQFSKPEHTVSRGKGLIVNFSLLPEKNKVK